MSSNLSEEIQRIKFLNNFITSKPLTEQTNDNQVRQDATRVNIQLPNKTERLIYPQYCKYPDKAMEPPPKYGGSESGLIDGYCVYPVTQPETSKIVGMHIPAGSTIEWRNENNIIKLLERVKTEYKDEDFKNYITDVLPPGTVASFTSKGNIYKTRLRKKDFPGSKWRFIGYFTKDGIQYIQPEWESKRTDYERFVDDWGVAVQFSVAIAAGMLIPVAGLGFTTSVLLELAIELVVGLPVAVREFQTNKTTSGIFSVVFSFLPLIKFSKTIKGFNALTSESLSRKFAESGLKQTSSVDEYIEFWGKLSDEEKNLLSAFLKNDESAELIGKEISNQIKDELKEEIIQQMKTDISKFKEIKFWNRMTGKELKTVGASVLLYFYLVSIIGEEESEYEKNKIDFINKYTSENFQIEFAYNVFQLEKDKVKTTIDLMYNLVKNPRNRELISTEGAAKNFVQLLSKYAVESNGGDFVPMVQTQSPDVEVEILDNNFDVNDGWKLLSEIGDEPWDTITVHPQTFDAYVKLKN